MGGGQWAFERAGGLWSGWLLRLLRGLVAVELLALVAFERAGGLWSGWLLWLFERAGGLWSGWLY